MDNTRPEDDSKILHWLRGLAIAEAPPGPAEEGLAIHLFGHSDADIRSAAIFAIALHWASPKALPALEHSVLQEHDPDVQAIAVRSIARIVLDVGGGVSSAVEEMLRRNVLDEAVDPELRGLSYLTLRVLRGRLSRQEYARSPDDIREMTVDWLWVRALSS